MLLNEKQLLWICRGSPEVRPWPLHYPRISDEPLAVEAAVQHVAKRVIEVSLVS
jgi:hypothetical protein